MRTVNGLFETLCQESHLERAARLSARGKRRRADVAWFLFRREAEIRRLSRELQAGSWRPSGFSPLFIRDPKPRVIARAPFADRVVHLALVQLLEPVVVRSLVDGVFASLPELGTHRAVLRLWEHVRRYRFALHLDIRAYFPSIDVERVRELLRRKVRDRRFLAVLDAVLDSGRGFYDDPEVRALAGLSDSWPPIGRGLPIGASTSQAIAAHLYLCALDHRIKRVHKIPGYVRYVDDFFLFGDSRAQLRRARTDIAEWLATERGLRLKHPNARILSCHGTLHGLGHAIRRSGVSALPRARKRFRKRIRQAMLAREFDEKHVRRSLSAGVGVLGFASELAGSAEPGRKEISDGRPKSADFSGGFRGGVHSI